MRARELLSISPIFPQWNFTSSHASPRPSRAAKLLFPRTTTSARIFARRKTHWIWAPLQLVDCFNKSDVGLTSFFTHQHSWPSRSVVWIVLMQPSSFSLPLRLQISSVDSLPLPISPHWQTSSLPFVFELKASCLGPWKEKNLKRCYVPKQQSPRTRT